MYHCKKKHVIGCDRKYSFLRSKRVNLEKKLILRFCRIISFYLLLEKCLLKIFVKNGVIDNKT